MSCDNEKERFGHAVVLTLSKSRRHTSCVSCLKLNRDEKRVEGNAFQLLAKSKTIWRNSDLRKAGIQEGSIIVVDQNGKFVNNTKEKMVSFYDCMTIDLFTDTAAILNLLDLRSIMGCLGGTRSVYTRPFRARENFNVYFSGKRRLLLHSKTAQRSFFLITNFF